MEFHLPSLAFSFDKLSLAKILLLILKEVITMTNKIKSYSIEETNAVQKSTILAKKLFITALERNYEFLNHADISNLLHSYYLLQNNEGLLEVLKDKQGMPFDSFVDIVMKPSYALAAISIWAFNNGNEFFDNQENLNKFSKLLKACLKFKLEDHGYEAQVGKLTNLLLFCKAGVKSFIEQNNPAFHSFNNFIKNEIASLKGKLETCKTTGKNIYYFAFEPYNATSKVIQILAAYEGKINSIFVYGTLMSPFAANKKFLGTSSFGGNFHLKNFATYDLGSYPAIKPELNKITYGEVWFIDNATLKTIDNYENEGYLYKRENVTVASSHGALDCQAYVYIDKPYGIRVEGRWNHEQDDYIWYACYGSNLSSERFTYYIKGGFYENRNYDGCFDKRLWKETLWCKVNGKMYFAKQSPRWDKCGVAFYNSQAKGKTIMRLYKITRYQLEEIKNQEGGWYDDIKHLGFAEDGYPIFTITSKTIYQQNEPSEKYSSLIIKALTEEFGMKETTARKYLTSCKL